jgi:hypothetical protein
LSPFNIIVAEPEEVAIDMYLVEKGFYADDVSRQSSRGGTDWWNLCQQAHIFPGLQTPCDVMSLLIQTTP